METLKKIFNSQPNHKLNYPNSKVSFHISTKSDPKSGLDILTIKADSRVKAQTVYQLVLKNKSKSGSDSQQTNICSNEHIEIPLGLAFWKKERELEVLEAPSLDKTLKQMIQLRSNHSKRSIKRTFFPGFKDKIIFSASQVPQPNFDDSEDDVQMLVKHLPGQAPEPAVKSDGDQTIVMRQTQALGHKLLLKRVLSKQDLPQAFWTYARKGSLAKGACNFIVELSDGQFKFKRPVSLELALTGFGSILVDAKTESSKMSRRRFRVERFGIESELFTRLNASLSVRSPAIVCMLDQILRADAKRPNLTPIRLERTAEPAKATKYYLEFASLREREHFLVLTEELRSLNLLKREWLMGRVDSRPTWGASLKHLKAQIKVDRSTKQLRKEKNYLKKNEAETQPLDKELYVKMKYCTPVVQRRVTSESESVHVERLFQRELLTLALRKNVHRSLKSGLERLKRQISKLKMKTPRARPSLHRQTVEKRVDMLLEQKHQLVERMDYLCERRDELEQLEKRFSQTGHNSIALTPGQKFSMLINNSEMDFFNSLPVNHLAKSTPKSPNQHPKRPPQTPNSARIESLEAKLQTLREQNRTRRAKQVKVLDKIRTLSIQANATLPRATFAETNDLDELMGFFGRAMSAIEDSSAKRQARHSKLCQRLESRV